MSDASNSYSGEAWLGVGPPLVIGVAIFVVGLVLMFVWRADRPDLLVRAARGRRPGARQPGRRASVVSIVLGYDESPGAERALDTAIAVAKRFGEPLVLAPHRLLHLSPRPVLVVPQEV